MTKRPRKRLVANAPDFWKWWSVRAGAAVSAVATAYAASPELQALISPGHFATGIAVANLIVIVLRTVNQQK